MQSISVSKDMMSRAKGGTRTRSRARLHRDFIFGGSTSHGGHQVVPTTRDNITFGFLSRIAMQLLKGKRIQLYVYDDILTSAEMTAVVQFLRLRYAQFRHFRRSMGEARFAGFKADTCLDFKAFDFRCFST